MSSCHGAIARTKVDADLTIALAGNPNVGKSSLFNQLTNLSVVTANYPGKTVELNLGATEHRGRRLALIDLPGTYALGGISEDQQIARQGLLDSRPDVVIAMAAAANLERNLYLALQLLDLEIPLVLALNMVDEAERLGVQVDAALLSAELGCPVVKTTATRGEGIPQLMDAAVARGLGTPTAGASVTCQGCPLGPSQCNGCASDRPGRPPDYGADIAGAKARLAAAISRLGLTIPYGLTPGALAMRLLEGDRDLLAQVIATPAGGVVAATAASEAATIAAVAGESAPAYISRQRHALAGRIAEKCTSRTPAPDSLAARLWRLSVQPATGIPAAAVVLALSFGLLYYAGNALSVLFADLWAATASPLITALVQLLLGDTVVGRTLLWGLDAGIQAALSIGVSYVLVFYLVVAVMEDTGYFNSLAFLADSVMHRLGLHGGATIPLMAAAGCNVPAIIGTRVLSTRRERVIASTLIVLIPCGARTAVIMGAVGQYAGPMYALAIFGIVVILVVVVGVALNAVLPGKSEGLLMEMFPFRLPDARTTLKKTWYRTRDFALVALPIVLVGSLGLGLLYETGWIWAFTAPLAPVVEGWLGLPAVAGLTLLFAVLRKELALQLLVTLAIVQYGAAAANLGAFMTSNQLFVYALVNTIYVPCIATIAVLGRELGWQRAAAISALTVTLALAAGGAARIVLG